ncbi:50S ribosomal protein L32 [Candidatus Poribacteria bacterium]|nr:MAG: 50S ribosomal protein L32 [Candidatus Poribacteria bacterium]
MAVPKRKVSKSRKRKRRSHHALPLKSLSICPNCHEPKMPHRACPRCGFYKGREYPIAEEL